MLCSHVKFWGLFFEHFDLPDGWADADAVAIAVVTMQAPNCRRNIIPMRFPPGVYACQAISHDTHDDLFSLKLHAS